MFCALFLSFPFSQYASAFYFSLAFFHSLAHAHTHQRTINSIHKNRQALPTYRFQLRMRSIQHKEHTEYTRTRTHTCNVHCKTALHVRIRCNTPNVQQCVYQRNQHLKSKHFITFAVCCWIEISVQGNEFTLLCTIHSVWNVDIRNICGMRTCTVQCTCTLRPLLNGLIYCCCCCCCDCSIITTSSCRFLIVHIDVSSVFRKLWTSIYIGLFHLLSPSCWLICG